MCIRSGKVFGVAVSAWRNERNRGGATLSDDRIREWDVCLYFRVRDYSKLDGIGVRGSCLDSERQRAAACEIAAVGCHRHGECVKAKLMRMGGEE